MEDKLGLMILPEKVKQEPMEEPFDEEADEALWQAQFAATPPEKFRKMIEAVQAEIRAGKTSPLDFTDK